MKHPLGLAGGAGGVEDEERVLGAHLPGRAVVGGRRHGVVVPDVPAVDPMNVAAGAFDHQHGLDPGTGLQGRVAVGLERNRAAASDALVGGDQVGGVAVQDAPGQGIRREAAEDHGMDRPDARAGQHGKGDLRDHGEIDRDPVARRDPVGGHGVGQAADLFVDLAVGDVAGDLRIVTLPDDRGVVPFGRQVAVQAVVAHVGGTVLVPLDVHVARPIGHVLDLGIGLEPVDALALLAPKALGIVDRLGVELEIGGFVAPGALGELLRHRKDAVLGHLVRLPLLLPGRSGQTRLAAWLSISGIPHRDKTWAGGM
jgi:hypothetical protein